MHALHGPSTLRACLLHAVHPSPARSVQGHGDCSDGYTVHHSRVLSDGFLLFASIIVGLFACTGVEMLACTSADLFAYTTCSTKVTEWPGVPVLICLHAQSLNNGITVCMHKWQVDLFSEQRPNGASSVLDPVPIPIHKLLELPLSSPRHWPGIQVIRVIRVGNLV